MTLDQILHQAITLHQQNRLADAEIFYRQVLAQKPAHPTALHLLGVLTGQRGDPQTAIDLIRRAIAIHPIEPMYHLNLGIFSAAAGRNPDAIAAFAAAVKLKPDWLEAWAKLGHAQQINGDPAAAVQTYRNAVQAHPNHAEAHNLLGSALQAQGNLEAAGQSYERAIALNPNLAEAHNNLGTIHRAAGRLDDAIAAYQAALRLNPNFAQAFNNLGLALQSKGDLDDAITAYQKALTLNPNYVEALGNLGGAHKDCADLDSALACFRRAMDLRPFLPEAHSNYLFTMQFHPNFTAADIAEEARRWSTRHADPLRPLIQPLTIAPANNRPLRIAFISPDFRDHCQSFFTLPLLSHLDRDAFHISLFSDVTSPDAITDRLRSLAHTWHNIVGQSDTRVANLIRHEKIDILIDLTMHMANNRLLVFAQKPAPIQITWLAYPGTTGLSTIDFRLTDPHLDPPPTSPDQPNIDTSYSEKSIRLPDTFWCYDPLTEEPPVNPLPADTNPHITFGSLNNFCKITESTLQLWSQVLTQIPNSHLLMLAPIGKSRDRLLTIFQNAGIQPHRLEFVPRLPRPRYMQVYHRIDIGLDTLPSNGHTTSLDSYFMGVPVITLVGKTITGRAGLSQLLNLNLPELIAHTPDQFISIATNLASDLPRLRTLRSTLRDRMRSSPLMNAPRFARAWSTSFSLARSSSFSLPRT